MVSTVNDNEKTEPFSAGINDLEEVGFQRHLALALFGESAWKMGPHTRSQTFLLMNSSRLGDTVGLREERDLCVPGGSAHTPRRRDVPSVAFGKPTGA